VSPTSNGHGEPQSYSRSVLPNGLRVITASMPHTRSAAVHLYIGVGARHEPPKLAGISHFVEHMVFKGTDRRPDPVMISEAIEGVGGQLNAATDHEHTGYSALVPYTHLPVALDVLTDMALCAQFEPAEVERERQVILEELSSTQDSPGELNDLLFDRMLWGTHPLGGDVGGSPKSVRRITRDDLISHTRHHYTPEKIVLSVAGNVRHEDVLGQAEALWARVHRGDAMAPTSPPEVLGEPVKIHRKRTAQANMILGVPALPYTDSRRGVQEVLDGLLGAGMSSRLFVELRENRGLAYSVSSFVRSYADVGAFGVHAAVDETGVGPALEIIIRELERIAVEPIRETELRKVKEYIKGQTMLTLERSGHVAHWAGWQELMLGRIESVEEVLERVEAVTPADISALASELFRRDRMKLALVGPFNDPSPYVDTINAQGAELVELPGA
jgi:predicted Zn-dependent peptidase